MFNKNINGDLLMSNTIDKTELDHGASEDNKEKGENLVCSAPAEEGSSNIKEEKLQIDDKKISDIVNKKVEEILKQKAQVLYSYAEKLTVREQQIEIREIESLSNFPKIVEERLESQKKALETAKQDYIKKLNELNKREAELSEKELKIDEQRQTLNNELQLERQNSLLKLQESNKKRLEEITESHSKRIDTLNSEFLKKQEIQNKELEADKNQRIEDLRKHLKEMTDEAETKLSEKELELQQREKKCNDIENKANEIKREYERKSDELSQIEADLKKRQDQFRQRVEDAVSQEKQNYLSKETILNNVIDGLRQQVNELIAEKEMYEDLKAKLGNEEPIAVLRRLQDSEKMLADARKQFLVQQNEDFDKERETLNNTISNLQIKLDDQIAKNTQLELSRGNQELEYRNQHLQEKLELVEGEKKSADDYAKILESRLERLSSEIGTQKNRDERILEIKAPVFERKSELYNSAYKDNRRMEIRWLNYIIESSMKYGLVFPKRLVYAFHTCLKSAELSPLTVLAGVSGTGKSELPKYYSKFGLFNFMSIAVQPNWDSQEAMLGYFNSIDNKFDAQPVLRFLAQAATERSEEYPMGMSDVMNMILLDEMNLAHVELYFADFLSKLESRRSEDKKLPTVDVKLGAGISPYELPLSRNLLWVGTMNQDETTKTLSDKVLDRGNVLFFPRPKKLVSRGKLTPPPEGKAHFTKDTWESWCNREIILTKDEIAPYKEIIEKINDALANVGRALGHRVWQSIEYYMNNYPTICELLDGQEEDHSGIDKNKLKEQMKIAFEDTVVQKVMPKLRGIETVGESKTRCLDRIRELLSKGIDGEKFSIEEDFNLACNNPFGQFIWNSANYIANEN